MTNERDDYYEPAICKTKSPNLGLSATNDLLVAKSPKRLNRKKLITQFEEMRQGFRDMRDLAGLTPLQRITPEALHRYADKIIVELGGESVLGN